MLEILVQIFSISYLICVLYCILHILKQLSNCQGFLTVVVLGNNKNTDSDEIYKDKPHHNS